MLEQRYTGEKANRIPTTSYQSVEIRIAKATEPHNYSVELSHPGSRDFPTRKMILNSADLLIHNANARDYGLLLGQALFADTALGDDFRESLAVLQREGKSSRLRLRLDDPDLHDIRWERLYYPIGDQWNPMAITASTPFSRYILAEDWGHPQPISQRPLRILVIIATPEDLNQYGLSTISPAECQAVHAIFDGLPDVVPTYLETGTSTPPMLENIRRELASGYHMVHFVCHGTVRQPGTILYLEKETGGVELVSAEKLIGSFRAAGTPPYFCFLAACESATHSRFDAFMPLGPRLVAEGGLTAVVAMSDKVSLTTASKFTAQFYTRLLNHGYVDLAANEARAFVRDNWDWSVPVLFSRLPDNRLLADSEIAHLEGIPAEKLKQQEIQQISLSAIRRQLNQMFDDPKLDAFCMDYFPQVYDKFSRGMRKDEKITLLLDHCRRLPDQLQKLLTVLEEIG
jgi:hypothetical protein